MPKIQKKTKNKIEQCTKIFIYRDLKLNCFLSLLGPVKTPPHSRAEPNWIERSVTSHYHGSKMFDHSYGVLNDGNKNGKKSVGLY